MNGLAKVKEKMLELNLRISGNFFLNKLFMITASRRYNK